MTNYRKRYVAAGKKYASDGVYIWKSLSKKPTTELKAEIELYANYSWSGEYIEYDVREVDKKSKCEMYDVIGATCDD
jgi:hypothetical protein